MCPKNCNPPLITLWVFECCIARIHISVTLRQLFHWNKKVLLFTIFSGVEAKSFESWYSWFLLFFTSMTNEFFQIHDSQRLLITYSFNDVLIGYLRNGKTGNEKRKIFATWLQNELNSDVARFTTHENKPCNLISCKTGSNIGGKTRNITIQLGLKQCCKTSCTFFVARFTTL